MSHDLERAHFMEGFRCKSCGFFEPMGRTKARIWLKVCPECGGEVIHERHEELGLVARSLRSINRLFQRVFGERTPKQVSLGHIRLGTGKEVRFTYQAGGAGKQDYLTCPNCGFTAAQAKKESSGGFEAVWTCRGCGCTFCTRCLSEDDTCPKCGVANFVQSGLIQG